MGDLKSRLANFLSDIWTNGRLDLIPRYVGDHYLIHHDPGDPWDGQLLNQKGFRDRVANSRAAAPDQVFTPVDMVAEGQRVAVAWTWTGTHLGDLPGFPASGRSLSMSGLTVYRFDGWDMLTGHWQIADRLGVAHQLMQQT